MPKTIWKFQLNVADVQTILVPEGAMILSLQVQHGQPCIWATVDPEQPKRARRVWTFGTGHELPKGFDVPYIGTYQLDGGALVFHVFVR